MHIVSGGKTASQDSAPGDLRQGPDHPIGALCVCAPGDLGGPHVKIISFDEGEFVLRGRGAVEQRWTRLVMRLPALKQQRMRLEAERAERERLASLPGNWPWCSQPADGR